MFDKFNDESISLLAKAILSLENEQDCLNFFDDVLTKQELLEISQRIYVAKMLYEKNSYAKIIEATSASTATISRINKAMLYGSNGYEKCLRKIAEGE